MRNWAEDIANLVNEIKKIGVVHSIPLSEMSGQKNKFLEKKRRCARCKSFVSGYTHPMRVRKKRGRGFRKILLCNTCREKREKGDLRIFLAKLATNQ